MKSPRVGPWIVPLLFALSLPAVTPRLYASDEVQYFAYLRSLWFDRDVSFDNEYRYFYDRGVAASPGFHETFLERTTETGRRINFGTLGCALLWSPFYAGADLVTRLAPGRDGAWAADGFSQPYLTAVAYGSATYGALAVWLAALTARRWAGHGTAAALVVWVGTPLLFYMYVAPPMSHACSAFAVAAFTAAWLRVRERWTARGMVLLGVLAALMTMVREQDAFFVVGPLLDFGRTSLRALRGRNEHAGPGLGALLGRASLGVLAAAVTYLPQALAYLALNGHIGPSRLVARKMTWTAPHALDVLLSPSHGFFFWTPLAVLALVGLLALAAGAGASTKPAEPERRWIAMCLLAMVAAQVWIAGSVESWTVAGAFGQRRFVALTLVLTVGVAAFLGLATAPAPRRVAATLIGLSVWWNLGLLVQFGAGLMDRQRLEPARNAYTTFVTLPGQAPMLLWRYLFDRESFYQRSPH
jgi:hypothetical protein